MILLTGMEKKGRRAGEPAQGKIQYGPAECKRRPPNSYANLELRRD